MPDSRIPADWNRYTYTRDNPINFADPSGYITQSEAAEANNIVNYLNLYQINIVVDWRDTSWNYYKIDPVDSSKNGVYTTCSWEPGLWSLDELKSTENAVVLMARGIRYLGGNFSTLSGRVTIKRENLNPDNQGRSDALGAQINLRDDITDSRRRPAIIIHEMGHIITNNQLATMSYFMKELETNCLNGWWSTYCYDEKNYKEYDVGRYAGSNFEYMPSTYARAGNWEDFAETFTVVVSEAYIESGNKAYIKDAKLVYEQNGYNHDIGRRRKVMKAILGDTWR